MASTLANRLLNVPLAISTDNVPQLRRLIEAEANPETLFKAKPKLKPFNSAAVAAKSAKANRLPHPSFVFGGIGHIPLAGPVVYGSSPWPDEGFFGVTFLADFADTLEALVNDPDVETILIEVDSPGGTVAGTPETADAVHAASKKKSVIAVVNPMAASAAFWIASQASKLITTTSGRCGSVGAVIVHSDVSEAARQQGVKITVLATSELKKGGNIFEPLSAPARSDMENELAAALEMFVSGLARGRKYSRSAVREQFGDGAMLGAEDAVRAGLADRIATLREVTTQLLATTRKSKTTGSKATATPGGLSPLQPGRQYSADFLRRRLHVETSQRRSAQIMHDARIAGAVTASAPVRATAPAKPSFTANARVAHHEAGHAVCNIIQGSRIDRVTIVPSANAKGACFTFETDPVKLAVSSHAGGLAEEAFTGRECVDNLADKEKAWSMAQGNRTAFDNNRMEAGFTVRENAAFIRAVAHALISRGTLTGAEVEALRPR